METIKECKVCGAKAEWKAMKLIARQDFCGEVLELRNCPCGATHAVPASELE